MNQPNPLAQNLIITSVLLILSVPFFWYLGNQSFRLWDEARFAGQAWEAYANGHWWIIQFPGDPDLGWSAKPPLVIWLQALLAKVIGFSEWSTRLPSAIAGWATMLLVFHWVWREFRDYRWALLAAAALVGANGFIGYHTARNGDTDSLLVFWMVLAAYSLYRATEKDALNGQWLFAVFLALVGAVMSKIVAGMLMMPGMALWILYRRQFAALWKSGWWYAGIIVFVAAIGGYYAYREMLSPGYLEAVWEGQVGGRYTETLDGHKHPVYFYFTHLAADYFNALWLLLIPLVVWWKALRIHPRIEHITRYALILTLPFLFVISLAGTKLPWYVLPALPFLAIMAAAGSWLLYQKLQPKYLVAILLVLFCAIHVGIRYQATFKPSRFDKEKELYAPAYWMKHKLASGENLDGLHVWYYGYAAHLMGYQWMAAERGQEVTFTEKMGLQPGMWVLVAAQDDHHYQESRTYLESNFGYDLLDEGPGFRVYLLTQP